MSNVHPGQHSTESCNQQRVSDLEKGCWHGVCAECVRLRACGVLPARAPTLPRQAPGGRPSSWEQGNDAETQIVTTTRSSVQCGAQLNAHFGPAGQEIESKQVVPEWNDQDAGGACRDVQQYCSLGTRRPILDTVIQCRACYLPTPNYQVKKELSSPYNLVLLPLPAQKMSGPPFTREGGGGVSGGVSETRNPQPPTPLLAVRNGGRVDQATKGWPDHLPPQTGGLRVHFSRNFITWIFEDLVPENGAGVRGAARPLPLSAPPPTTPTPTHPVYGGPRAFHGRSRNLDNALPLHPCTYS